MSSHFNRRLTMLFAVTMVVALLFTLRAAVLTTAAPPTQGSKTQGPFVGDPVTPFVFDGHLSDLPKAEKWKPGDTIRVVPKQVYAHPSAFTLEEVPSEFDQASKDPLMELQQMVSQSDTASGFSTATLNIEGIPFTGAFPPDTVGDVGSNHYIQMVNDGAGGGSVLSIFDKAGNLISDSISLQSLWDAGGACSSGAGDPIVLYDRLADRWLLSEFADTGNHLCVYISQTSDPIGGGWFLYDFIVPEFPDYPKYAVWPDAYYVSSNESSPAVYALDRSQMLNGDPATFQRFEAPGLAGFDFQALTPSDLDGLIPPPPGSPAYFMRHRDDEVHNPGSNDPNNDFLEIWEYDVDFATPANSTFTQTNTITVTEFDSDLCGLSAFECFPQPGTATTLDPLREVIMWRLQYRNFGLYETLVGNFVTDVDGTDHGGIRWFELRKIPGETWELFQEGTYAPDQANRWMGSIAMDRSGNIALGYSVSSDVVSPSIRYTGRLASDPVGQLSQGEHTLIDGGGSQTVSSRWGDYSSMNVDPADDCTFWYTNEYVPVGAGGNWRTRIGTFRFPSCEEPLDIYFLVDLSGSFADDLPNFKAEAPDIMSTLRDSNPNSRFGLGSFEDYPISPFGDAASGDVAYRQNIDLTFDTDAVEAVINDLFTRYGADGPQSQLPALFQAATGEGQDLSGEGFPGASIPPDQQANFRDGATKLFLLWTDASFHQPGDPGTIPYPGPSFTETTDAILALDPPKVIGISSGGGGVADLQRIAEMTDSLAPPGGVDCDDDGVIDIPEGEPLVCSIAPSGEGIGKAIIALVEAAAQPVISIDIDIWPFLDDNIIVLNKNHSIPVSILSTETFSATSEVDLTSLTFGQTGDEETLDFCLDYLVDVNEDGLLDQTCIFRNGVTGFQLGDIEGVLRGQTIDGTPIEGRDSVQIVPPLAMRHYTAPLSGDNEVPSVETDAVGTAKLDTNRNVTELQYRLDVFNLEDITAAHIHCGAAGTNGPVGVTLFSGDPVTQRTFKGVVMAPDDGNACGWTDLDAVVTAMWSGDTYVNVHTVAYPSGEIRGQIEPID